MLRRRKKMDMIPHECVCVNSQAESFTFVLEDREKHAVIRWPSKHERTVYPTLRDVTAETFDKTASATCHAVMKARTGPA